MSLRRVFSSFVARLDEGRISVGTTNIMLGLEVWCRWQNIRKLSLLYTVLPVHCTLYSPFPVNSSSSSVCIIQITAVRTKSLVQRDTVISDEKSTYIESHLHLELHPRNDDGVRFF